MADYHLGLNSQELPPALDQRAALLQELLVRHATGSRESDDHYQELRRDLVKRSDIAALVPTFVRNCRTLPSFWSWIKEQSGHYEPRRAIIREAFANLLDHLETDNDPADAQITEALSLFDEAGVKLAWSKALDRKRNDPEGAITSARTLLETVCKKILDDAEQHYNDVDDLPKLYGMAAASLNLAPDGHTEKAFRSILGGCQTIVNNLGTLRNRLGDAHGMSRMKARPAPRHATLAVNLAGSMALFLVETSDARREQREQHERKLSDPRFVDDVLGRITISDVIGRHVELKKSGREWRGLSPFIAETTPSFYVNDIKGFFHCFSSSKHGTALDFLVEVQGLSRPAATELLAKEAGLPVQDWEAPDPSS